MSKLEAIGFLFNAGCLFAHQLASFWQSTHWLCFIASACFILPNAASILQVPSSCTAFWIGARLLFNCCVWCHTLCFLWEQFDLEVSMHREIFCYTHTAVIHQQLIHIQCRPRKWGAGPFYKNFVLSITSRLIWSSKTWMPCVPVASA